MASRRGPPGDRATRVAVGNGTDITEQEIYEYLSRVALGPEKLDDVFSIEGLATIPLFATANLLLSFCPRDKEWWEYLDQIWDAAETADRVSLSVLPALMLRARKFVGGGGLFQAVASPR